MLHSTAVYGSPHIRIYFQKESERELALLTAQVWQTYFSDVPQPNIVMVNYDYHWKNRLGRIRMTKDEHRSEIALNGILQTASITDELRIGVISHEIVHYAHGFGSPLSSSHQHAHAHGIVSVELAERGLAHVERNLLSWIDQEWDRTYQHYVLSQQRSKYLSKRKLGYALA